jgi:hypothetical protein
MMKRLILLLLLVFLSACDVESEEVVLPPVVTETPEVIEEEISTPAPTRLRGRAVVAVGVEGVQESLDPIFGIQGYSLWGSYNEANMSHLQEIVLLYNERLLTEVPPSQFGIESLVSGEMIVQTRPSGQRIIMLQLAPGVPMGELVFPLSEEDFASEGRRILPYYEYELDEIVDPRSFGRIGILSYVVGEPSNSSLFAPVEAEVFNDIDAFFAEDFDTRVIIYDQNLIWNLNPGQFGEPLFPGTSRGFTDEDGTKYILTYVRDGSELNVINPLLLSLNGRLSRALLMIELANYDPSSAFYQSVPFMGQLNSLSRGVSLDVCRVRQPGGNDGRYHDVRGFPHVYSIPPKGTINIAILAVDFPNAFGEEEYLPIYQSQIETIEAWATFVSGGAMTYKVHFPNEWIRAPKGAEYYTNPEARFGFNVQNTAATVGRRLQSNDASISQIITAADHLIDWSIIDFAQFIFPYETEQAFGTFLYTHGGQYRTPSGTFDFPVFAETVLMFGPPSPNPAMQTHWDWIVHEVLHFQGIIGHGPLNGSAYGIMMNQHASSKALIAWESFMMDHYDERHVACLPPSRLNEPFSVQLESIDQTGGAPGIKSVMVPLGGSEILVVEYRTDGPFSTLPNELQGFLVYYMDVSKPWVRCDACNQLELEKTNFWRFLRQEEIIQECFSISDDKLCGLPSVAQKPGYMLEFNNIRFDFFDDGVLTIQRRT